MKSLLTAALLITLSQPSFAVIKADEQTCKEYSQFASFAVYDRFRGETLSENLPEIRKIFQGRPSALALVDKMMVDAFSLKVPSNHKQRSALVDDFENKQYIICMGL